MTIRVLLVDDQSLLRLGFRMALETQPDVEVIGEAGDGAQAVAMTRTLHPDVVLMDVQMPVMDGLEATRQIVAAGLAARILVLTTFNLDEYVYAALRAGASGFLLKNVPPADLFTPASEWSPPATPWSPRASPADSSTRSPATYPTRQPDAHQSTNGCTSSPTANARSSPRWPAAAPTPRSPSDWEWWKAP